jgi:hypothetical protein
MESPMSEVENLAYSIAQIASVGRTFIYEEIKSGRLRLKKAGRRSLILAEDAQAWLRGLPGQSTRACDE